MRAAAGIMRTLIATAVLLVWATTAVAPAEPARAADADEDDYRYYYLPPDPGDRLVWRLLWAIPAAVLGVWLLWRVLLAIAPVTAYRIRARLPAVLTGRAGIRAEAADLERRLLACDLPHLRYKLARLYLRLDRHRAAVGLLTPVLDGQTDHVDALYIGGRCRVELGRADEAAPLLEKALALDENHDYGGLVIAAARAWAALGRTAQAEERLRRLLSASPDLPEALYVLGQVLAAAGRKAEAAQAWRQCVQGLRSAPRSFRRKNLEWLRKARARVWFG
jgi:hypothetical protein